MKATLCFLLAVIAVTSGQIFPSGFSYDVQPHAAAAAPIPIQRRAFAHRAVVENAAAESQLPDNLLNPFYKNPRIRDALAKESWFTAEEMQVFDREAEKIPRGKVYSILHNAGLARR